MYLSAYHIDGDPAVLVPAFDRCRTEYFGDDLDLNLCVIRAGGITIYDVCPSAEVSAEFHASPQFRLALAETGLPFPRIELVGDVHSVVGSMAPAR